MARAREMAQVVAVARAREMAQVVAVARVRERAQAVGVARVRETAQAVAVGVVIRDRIEFNRARVEIQARKVAHHASCWGAWVAAA